MLHKSSATYYYSIYGIPIQYRASFVNLCNRAIPIPYTTIRLQSLIQTTKYLDLLYFIKIK